MKLSDKQAIILFDIAKESLKFVGVFSGYTSSSRVELVNEILEQQSNKPIELKKSMKHKS